MAQENTDGTKPTAAQKRQFQEMIAEMRSLQSALEEHWLDLSTPALWAEIKEPEQPDLNQTRINIRLDNDVLHWYRKTGLGYMDRINQVLRIYMHAVLSGQVQTHHHDQSQVSIFTPTQSPE